MTNQITRDSFIFYRSFFETIEDLEDKQQLEIYRAIAQYSLNDEPADLSGISRTIFRLIEPQLLANKKRFVNGKLGAEHGKKGGRPKTPKEPQENPTLTPNKNVNVNVNKNNNQNDNENLHAKKSFQKPLLKDVIEYCQERKNFVNAEKWFAYYEANGWKVGKNPMKDWKAAVRTWENNEKQSSTTFNSDKWNKY